MGVSIHAPTRGATSGGDALVHKIIVSIHAPTRGATSVLLGRLEGRRFQSTRPRGARHSQLPPDVLCIKFQSTRPRGARQDNYVVLTAAAWFQSTRPRGARPRNSGLRGGAVQSFNPRAHAGRDTGNIDYYTTQFVSIHAPTRGATRRRGNISTRGKVSIHAPTRGATRTGAGVISNVTGFNPRAHAGRDPFGYKDTEFGALFQSTRPRGARHGRARALFPM